jgi:hypothetical protein
MVYLTMLSYLNYMASNNKIINDYRFVMDLEVRYCGLVVLLSQHMPEGTEENNDKTQSGQDLRTSLRW